MKKATTVVKEWFRRHRYLQGESKIYSRKEWQELGEKYGNTAEATIIIDGSPMYEQMNYGTYNPLTGMINWSILEKFTAHLAKYGYWFELGYSWTIHIYKN